MQLLGIAFILYLLKLSAGNGFSYQSLGISWYLNGFIIDKILAPAIVGGFW